MELVMKCLWKVIRAIPDWIQENMNLDLLLLELHEFLKVGLQNTERNNLGRFLSCVSLGFFSGIPHQLLEETGLRHPAENN